MTSFSGNDGDLSDYESSTVADRVDGNESETDTDSSDTMESASDSVSATAPFPEFELAFIKKQFIADTTHIREQSITLNTTLKPVVVAVKAYINYVYPNVPAIQIDTWYLKQCNSITAVLDIDQCITGLGFTPRHNARALHYKYVEKVASNFGCINTTAARWVDITTDETVGNSDEFGRWYKLLSNLYKAVVEVWNRLEGDMYFKENVEQMLENAPIRNWFNKELLDIWVEFAAYYPIEDAIFTTQELSVNDGVALWTRVKEMFMFGAFMKHNIFSALIRTEEILSLWLSVQISPTPSSVLFNRMSETVDIARGNDVSVQSIWNQL